MQGKAFVEGGDERDITLINDVHRRQRKEWQPQWTTNYTTDSPPLNDETWGKCEMSPPYLHYSYTVLVFQNSAVWQRVNQNVDMTTRLKALRDNAQRAYLRLVFSFHDENMLDKIREFTVPRAQIDNYIVQGQKSVEETLKSSKLR